MSDTLNLRFVNALNVHERILRAIQERGLAIIAEDFSRTAEYRELTRRLKWEKDRRNSRWKYMPADPAESSRFFGDFKTVTLHRSSAETIWWSPYLGFVRQAAGEHDGRMTVLRRVR